MTNFPKVKKPGYNSRIESKSGSSNFNHGLRVNSLINQYQNKQNPSIVMLGHKGISARLTPQLSAIHTTREQRAQTGLGFHRVQLESNHYQDLDIKRPINTGLTTSISDLNRSASRSKLR